MTKYYHIPLKSSLNISSFVNASRVKYDKNYNFKGEKHDFWEFQYMESGSAIIYSNNEFYELKKGLMTFFKPEQFHILWGNGKTDGEMWVFSFRCDLPFLDNLDQLFMKVPDKIYKVMEMILDETEANYEKTNSSEDGKLMKKRQNFDYGCDQIIKNCLEELVLLLVREKKIRPSLFEENGKLPGWNTKDLTTEIYEYIKRNLKADLTLETISKKFHISESYAKRIYKKRYGNSIISDHNKFLIEKAKERLISGNESIGDIAVSLGFSNIYYFSNRFKKVVGVSPKVYRQENAEKQ